ncbi:DUF4126 domain-containing protein [Flavihumibacter rivuli]|uniref:DUF4126 domain-containing protein n=1 Tax=Flavihumibacter rivuli TaxID=2838156 RepID=UPI001BDE5BDF|nr:DUF4126 domain-containing protein [Flavihumibacter rivuli]ULQ58038.1 DUF4126 domain-containing protein [Flavihumibacter rivuli]
MGPYITAIAIGIGLSACCGFRVFVPLLAASLAGYLGWIPLNQDMAWLGTMPAIISFGVASVLEIGAYYVPFIDNLLDTIASPLAVAAGTLVAASVLPAGEMEPLLRWGLGLIAGGATAGSIQLGTGILRLFSTKSTAGTGNALVATGENAAAITGSALSLLVPVIFAVIMLVLAGWIIYKAFGRLAGK